jgi:parallel beta-helix repeat protein
LRGVMASGFRGQITHNVISGNLRSGIYLTAANNTAVTDNRIGVSAGTDDPLPNGASGVFFGDTSTVSTAPVSFADPLLPVTVEGNVIEFNHDFGVALDPNSSIQILDNVIAHNRGAAIDLGMDGLTLGSISGPVAPMPAVAAARYDAATGETSIEGTAAATTAISHLDYTATVYLYASDSALSEGQRFLGTAPTDRAGRFVFRIKSDLRGKYISATTDLAAFAFLQDGAELVTARTTSEFSPTTAVMDP